MRPNLSKKAYGEGVNCELWAKYNQNLTILNAALLQNAALPHQAPKHWHADFRLKTGVDITADSVFKFQH